MKLLAQLPLAPVLAASLLFPFPAHAALLVTVHDAAGRPLPDTAVYAEPLDAAAPVSRQPRTVEVEQKNRAFTPAVTVVQAGTSVVFPNRDSVRHHVYSFSPTKVFDLDLFAGEPPKPVSFDKPGTVVVGCNIHDPMAAWVHVVGTPYLGKTDGSGRVRLDGLPPGRYRLKAWHPGLPEGEAPAERMVQASARDEAVTFTLDARR